MDFHSDMEKNDFRNTVCTILSQFDRKFQRIINKKRKI